MNTTEACAKLMKLMPLQYFPCEEPFKCIQMHIILTCKLLSTQESLNQKFTSDLQFKDTQRLVFEEKEEQEEQETHKK